MPRWRVIVIETGLVLFCGLVAVIGLLETIGCLNEGQPTTAAICGWSGARQSWYAAGLAAGPGIAVVGVVVGHVRHSWRIVLLGAGLGLTVVIGTMVWGLHSVAVPQQ
jgi:hypothetical protein